MERKQPWLAMAAVLAAAVMLRIRTKNLLEKPRHGSAIQTVTDWDGVEQAAAVSRDGHFLAFFSESGRTEPDVWITQIGSGQFHNVTHGRAPELVDPSVRTLGFWPDSSLVTLWVSETRNGCRQDQYQHWALEPSRGG